MAQSKNWCYTLNNPTLLEKESIKGIFELNDECIAYHVLQLEEGEEGTPHLQGYIQFKKRVRMNQAKELLSPRVHLEKANGSAQQNRTYCTKEPRLEGPWEYGVLTTQGKRNDIVRFKDAMKENIMPESDILENFPEILAKFPRFVATTRRILTEAQIADTPLIPRPGWQTELRQYLDDRPHRRQVLWYFDSVGGSGKSYFSRYLRIGGRRAFVITGGKYADIYHAYDRQQCVIFDWPRSQEDTFPYAVVETFKNGYFLSTKYESTPVFFDVPHVIVFANFYPDKSKLSADRWNIHIIDNTLLTSNREI